MGAAVTAGIVSATHNSSGRELQNTLSQLIDDDRAKLQAALDELGTTDEPEAVTLKSETAPEGKEQEPRKLLDFFDVGDIIGEGSFGVVYACQPHDRDTRCAVKLIDKVEAPMDTIMEEVNLMRKLDHPNVIKCYDVFHEKCFVCIVMDRLQDDLVTGMQMHWQDLGTIPVPATSRIAAQMSTSTHYIHSQNIIHRDIKGDNYLIDRVDITDPDLRVVLIDFGTALYAEPGQRLSKPCGTKLYWSPEFYGRDYSFKVDVWAMGVVIYGLLCGRFPFRSESEVQKKLLTFGKGVPAKYKTLVKEMLAKREEKRSSAADVASNPTLFPNGVATLKKEEEKEKDIPLPEKEEAPPEKEEEALHKETADHGIQERRLELVERMVNAKPVAGERKVLKKATTSVVVGDEACPPGKDGHAWKDFFSVMDKREKNSVFSYRWEGADQVPQMKAKTSDPAGEKAKDKGHVSEETLDVISKQFEHHGIDTTVFGKGKAKTLEALAAEVYSGASVLMLDATEHKKLVRVVEMVALRISAPATPGDDGDEKILIEVGEKFADGRERSVRRLPGTKKSPHENSKQVAQRYAADFLGHLSGSKLVFDYSQIEEFEEELVSPSYPGVCTVYRKSIIDVRIEVNTSDSAWAERFQTNYEWSHQDLANYTKSFKWVRRKQCDSDGIQYKSPTAWTFSALVQAPIGKKEEDLSAFLTANNIDISQFGQGKAKTLQDFSSELCAGDSTLVHDPDGSIVRVVEPVLVKLVNGENEKVLMQIEQTLADGTKVSLNRLPGTIRRPDENMFFAARRVIEKGMKINPNSVDFCVTDVETVEEEDKESAAYPGLRTLYQKRIVTARLTR